MPEHIGIDRLCSPTAIVTGDPERAEYLASQFAGVLISKKRGFLCYVITYKESTIHLLSSGIGSPSAAIVVEELTELGANVIVRIGTCGALQNEIQVGDIVVSTGSVRDEGTSKQYIDQVYPAVPDLFLTHLLIKKTKEIASVNVHYGITHSKDAYYSEKTHKSVDEAQMRARWLLWKRANVLATEMEASALFILGSLRKARTAGAFISVGSKTKFGATLHTFEELVTAIFLTTMAKGRSQEFSPNSSASTPNQSFLSET